MRYSFLSLILTLLLSACAKPNAQLPKVGNLELQAERQKQLTFDFDNYMIDFNRVKTVGHKIRTANTDSCHDQLAPNYGFETSSLEEMKKPWRGLAASRLNLSNRVGVIQIVEDGPAYRAGLKTGDQILRLNGMRVASSKGANRNFWRQMKTASDKGTIRLDVSRETVRKAITIHPVRSCAYPVLLANKGEKNAYTDGSKIVVHRGLLKLASTDDELALVIGHELAHITAEHLSKKKTNQYLGMAGGFAVDVAFAAFGVNTGGTFTESLGNVGAVKHSKEFEKEADYLSMYYLAKAGYRTRGVETFWRKMSADDARAISIAATHPSSPERFLLIKHTHEEILQKRKTGQKLSPNRGQET